MSFTVHKKLRESLATIRQDNYTPSHIAVLECLAYRINDKTQICFPSEQTIADESYLSERHVRKILSQLEQDGIVEILRQSRKSNKYRLHIKPHISQGVISHLSRISVVNSADEKGFLSADPGVESHAVTSEARLTYNLNLSLNSRSETIHSSLKDSPSESLHTETRPETGFPVQSANPKAAASTDVLTLYGFLMKKISSACTEPMATDAKLLTEAIAAYGLAEVVQLIEGVYKLKDKYWREKLKTATHPCSMLSRSLPTIKQQFRDKEQNAVEWMKRRAAERRSEQ